MGAQFQRTAGGSYGKRPASGLSHWPDGPWLVYARGMWRAAILLCLVVLTACDRQTVATTDPEGLAAHCAWQDHVAFLDGTLTGPVYVCQYGAAYEKYYFRVNGRFVNAGIFNIGEHLYVLTDAGRGHWQSGHSG